MRNDKKLKKIAKKVKALEEELQNGGDPTYCEQEIEKLISDLTPVEILELDEIIYEDLEN